MAVQSPRSRFLSEALRSYEKRDAGILVDLAADYRFDTLDDEVESLSVKDNQILFEMQARLREAQGETLSNRRLSLARLIW